MQAVLVQQDHQIVQLVFGRGLHRLPDLALVALAVAHQTEHPVVFSVPLAAQGHARGHAQPLAKGAGGDVDAGAAFHVRVPLKDGVLLAQGSQLLSGEEAPEGQTGIQHRADMALGENKAVPVRPFGILRVQIQLIEIQRGHQVRRGQRAAGVPRLCGMYHGQDFPADLFGLGLQADSFFIHCQRLLYACAIMALMRSKPDGPILNSGTSTASWTSRLMEIWAKAMQSTSFASR